MALVLPVHHRYPSFPPLFSLSSSSSFSSSTLCRPASLRTLTRTLTCRRRRGLRYQAFKVPALRNSRFPSISASALDLTEENIRQVLADARTEFAQIFDTSVGITGEVDLVEVDGPFVKVRLRGRFWHKRSTVLARLDNYLKNRIPEILEVDIEDKKQLDDSPENF